jgi:uncharacterized membrane protein YccC
MAPEARIAWDWSGALRGGLSALPGAVLVLAVDVQLGMATALGALIVAALGVPSRRSRRPRLALVGVAFGVAYSLGSIAGLSEVAAVVSLAALAYAGVALGARRPAFRLLPALLLPGFALGMNHPAPDGFGLAAVLVAGALGAAVVTYAWPQSQPPAVAVTAAEREHRPAPPGPTTRVYAALFALAAGIGLGLGYALDLVHAAWAAAAAMFIMRPDPGLTAGRAVGRTVATFAGVVAAGLLVRRGPTEPALALLTVAAVAAMIAVRASRWYVTPAGSALLVLLLGGVAGADAFEVSFVERLLETALGAALALLFGVAIPALLRARRRVAGGPPPRG